MERIFVFMARAGGQVRIDLYRGDFLGFDLSEEEGFFRYNLGHVRMFHGIYSPREMRLLTEEAVITEAAKIWDLPDVTWEIRAERLEGQRGYLVYRGSTALTVDEKRTLSGGMLVKCWEAVDYLPLVLSRFGVPGRDKVMAIVRQVLLV